MNCRRVSNLLSAYMDGEVAGVEHIQIQRHLRDCPCCYEEYESLLTTKRLLSSLAMQQPRADLEDEILDRLTSEREGRHGLPGPRAWWSLLTENQRRRARLGFLCAVMCSLSVLLAVTRISRSLNQEPSLAFLPQPALRSPYIAAGGPAEMEPAGASYGVPSRAPMADYLEVHNSWDDAQPLHPGVVVSPVASMDTPGSLLVPRANRSGP